MKHEPFDEYREAAYKFSDLEVDKTRLYQPASALKAALRDVAIDMVGARKAVIGRLTTIIGEKLPLYGVPFIKSQMVRSSDIKRTPDIRTLPILKEWAIPGVIVQFASGMIKESSVANLLSNAGIIVGIGDGRPQKGYFAFGRWRLVGDDDKELLAIVKAGGRAAQEKALNAPEFYDIETSELLEWFLAEKKKRSAAPAHSTAPKKKAKKDEAVDIPLLSAAQANGRKRGRRGQNA